MAANGAPAVTAEEVEELRKQLESLQVGMRLEIGPTGAAAAAAASGKASRASCRQMQFGAARPMCPHAAGFIAQERG